MDRRNERLGLAFAALCALNGAFVPAIAKLTTALVDPLAVAALTTAFAGAFAAALLAARGELGLLARRDTLPGLVAIGALGTALAFTLFFEGAKRATAIETALCLQVEPIYSLVATRIFLGHPISPRRAISALVLLAGIALALGAGGLSGSSGVWLLLVTPICWQASHLIVLRRLQGVPPHVLTSARYVFGALLLAGIWLASSSVGSGVAVAEIAPLLPLLAVQGVVLSFGGTVVWYQALSRLDLARTTAIVVPSVPLLSLGASFVVLGEVASAQQWLGLLLTAGGVLSFVTAPHVVERRERIPTQTAPIAAPVDPAEEI